MRKLFSILVPMAIGILLTATVWAQSPEKISYQAVIRNSSEALVTNTTVGMQISILQGSASGTAVYVETQSPTTNANGLVSLEIGVGTVVSGDFTTIDWANGTYFIKTETDPTGGTSYTITGTSQLLSVPYALHAKTAESVSGTITETDPVFTAWDKSTGISITESQISDLDHFTTANETDPVYGASVASGITATDTTSWNNKLDSETDPEFNAWDKTTGISITESQISNLQSYLTSETDPSVAANFDFTDAVTGDLLQFNGTKWVKVTPDYISDYTVIEADVTAHEAALTVSESQISDLGNYIETETQNLADVITLNNSANAQIKNVTNPTDAQDAATKAYVDQLLSLFEDNGMVVVDFSVADTDISLGNSVAFTDNSVLATTTWQWDFGDGNTSTEQNPTHTYTAEGTYTVSLTASNGVLSSTKTKNDYITVSFGSFTDSRDGTEYQTITIGNQEWMGENLKYLPSVVGPATGSEISGFETESYYYVYDYDGTSVADAKATTNYTTYGVLYNYTAACNSCPAGWHLPSDAEWTELTDYLGETVAGGKLKETGTTHWNSPNTDATNETGFTALPGGFRSNDGNFYGIGSNGSWWGATEGSTGSAWRRSMYYSTSGVNRDDRNKELGFSVRCLRD